MLSLSASPEDSPRGRALHDTLADGDAVSEDDVILRLDYAKARKRILVLIEEILGDRERKVFLARCMPASGDATSLDALSRAFGVTRERIHQIEASARRKVATVLANEGFAHMVDEFPSLQGATPDLQRDIHKRAAGGASHRGPDRINITKAAG